jgi:RHS repeat-associated protein
VRTAYNGSVEGSYTSLPFGDNMVTTGADNDPYHYAMQDHDRETDTEHAGARQYSSSQGRWLSPDLYQGSYHVGNPQSLNRYVYVLNTPVSSVDPTGLDCGDDNQVACGPPSTVQGDPTGTVYYDWDTGQYLILNGDGTLSVLSNQGSANVGGCSFMDGCSPVDPSSLPQSTSIPNRGIPSAPSTSNAPDNGPHYTMADVCAASTLLNKGGQTALDALGIIPGEGNLLKGVQLGAGLISAGIAIFGDSSPTDGALSGTGLGLSAVDIAGPKFTASLFGKSFSVVPVLGNLLSVYATYNDIKGPEGMGAYYDDCMAGKN